MMMEAAKTIFAVDYPMGHLSGDILRLIKMAVNGTGIKDY